MELDYCFCCKVKFSQSYDGGELDWPGVIFEAKGNWGSTIFDSNPFKETPERLIIRVCDACVLERRLNVVEHDTKLPPKLRDDVKEFIDKGRVG